MKISHRDESRTGAAAGEAERAAGQRVFDRAAVRAIDLAAVEEYGIPGIVLMENAARGLARHALAMLRESGVATPKVLIVCGSGNNGGDGYALARHLHNHCVDVRLMALGEPVPGTEAAINREICRRMNLAERPIEQLADTIAMADVALIVDAIFGTGLDRAVTGRAAQAIEWINAAGKPVLAVDVPSGMDCDTGRPAGGEGGPIVRAVKTVTFVGPKPGFNELHAQKLLGEVVVADIGAPRELLERFGR